jgi:cyclopropane-fatty-acyl-phospholipid synthase
MHGPMAPEAEMEEPFEKLARRPLVHGAAAAVVRRWLSGWRVGRLDVGLPDGSSWTFGDAGSDRRVTLSVRDWRFFSRLLARSDVGLGESYMAGEWRCDHLVELFRLIIANDSIRKGEGGLMSLAARLASRLRRRSVVRGPRDAAEDVRAHYDVGNEFFATFLDDTMTYSAAIFTTPVATLEQAQREKLDRLCRRLELRPGLRVLDIGCGWGSFAIHAAVTYGCRVSAITLSPAQHTLASERVRVAGCADMVDVRLCDYREVDDRFDRIVSIEMLEAIGFEQYDVFFRACDRLLAPDGRVALQVITYPDQDYETYRRDVDWLRTHVFPGTMLLSMRGIGDALARLARLGITWRDDIGPHYATTLRHWRTRYLRALPEIRRLGFAAPFLRKWDLYLAMCEAAFATHRLGTVQLLLGRPERASTALS